MIPSPTAKNYCFTQSTFQPHIGVYSGRGASHSWLWFAEILDRMGLDEVVFLNERDIVGGGLDRADVLLMSGGDTFAIAEGLGEEGSGRLRNFIKGGGLYIGTCAGAYLPLRSSMPYLNRFNFIDVKISNISRRLSEDERSLFEKSSCSSYGCDFIYHVVREEVVLKMAQGFPGDKEEEMIAPLYGGPSMLPSEDIEPIATYNGFTKKTRFLVKKELAVKTLIGKIAVCKKGIGDGELYLFGPHFEHPHYPPCNLYLREIIFKHLERGSFGVKKFFYEEGQSVSGDSLKGYLKDLKRELSNARIQASGMSDINMEWLIGNKLYQTEKINVFLNFIWDKLKRLETLPDLKMDGERLGECIEISKSIPQAIQTIRKKVREGDEAIPMAKGLFENLKLLSACFLNLYFKSKRVRKERPMSGLIQAVF